MFYFPFPLLVAVGAGIAITAIVIEHREELSEFFENVAIDVLEKTTESRNRRRRRRRRAAAAETSAGFHNGYQSSETETIRESLDSAQDIEKYGYADCEKVSNDDSSGDEEVEEKLYQNIMRMRQRTVAQSQKNQEINHWIENQDHEEDDSKSETASLNANERKFTESSSSSGYETPSSYFSDSGASSGYIEL